MDLTIPSLVFLFFWLPCHAHEQGEVRDSQCLLQVQQAVAPLTETVSIDTAALDLALFDTAWLPARQVTKRVGFLDWLPAAGNFALNSWTVAVSVGMVLGLGLVFLAGGMMCPTIPRPVVSILVIAVYIALSVTIDLLIMYQKSSATPGKVSTYKFDPTCSIILTEFIKLICSASLYTSNQLISGSSLMPEGLNLSDVKLFMLPATFFTANNILVFVAIGGNDASAFGVFRDTMILWTALIWAWIFKASLGPVRLGGIAIIFAGLLVNRAGSISRETFSWTFLLVILMTVTNATGSVLNEFALKFNKALDINLQNCLLYSMCIVFSVLILAVKSPAHLASPTAFFEGFTNWTIFMVFLQASAGLLVSRLLKYADAVYKTIGTCLRGPSLVICAPMVLGSQTDAISILSALIVASGCLTYLTQGPLSVPSKGDQSLPAPESAGMAGNTKKSSELSTEEPGSEPMAAPRPIPTVD